MEKLLGEGAFGEVYKGIVKCPIVNPKVRSTAKSSICTPVAIKLLKCTVQAYSIILTKLQFFFSYMQYQPREMRGRTFSQR